MKSRVIIALLVLTVQAPAASRGNSATAIDPSDKDILYTGRWYQADRSAPWCSWQACSIVANFKGTSISARLQAVADDKDWVFVIIDDDKAGARTIALTGGTADYLLASELSDATHKVEIVKKSNAGKDHIVTFHGFKVTGPGLTSPPARPRLKLEFYGDSNLAAYSVEHEQNRGDMKYRDSYYCFAGIASRMLDAEYHNISKGGERVHDVMKNIWDKYYPNSSEIWDFSNNCPDAVIVNLGMRGATDGAEGKIAIEFKDQKMWTDPLDTYTATKTLTTDWRQYSVTRTAPTGGSKPVFQIKVVLQASSGDTVCFDDVRMHKHSR